MELDSEGHWQINNVIEGNTVKEVLGYVEYNSHELIERLRVAIEISLKQGRLTTEESAKLQKKFREALDSYTYLVV